ncbi:MAG: hypothetical protein O2894_06280 [Planctomycetota bacterium]|nr:hypothetical protein [Planctomycetota bacterium]
MSLERIQELLVDRCGIDPDSLSRIGVASAIKRRMAATGLEGIERYANRIVMDPAEFHELVSILLVHETSFFRYPASFTLLAGEGAKRLAGDAQADLRVLSVACSTGEEPASVLMALYEAGADPARIQMDAFDLSPRAIEYARAGRYRSRGVDRLPAAQIARWFTPDGDGYRLSPDVRDRINYGVKDALAVGPSVQARSYHAIFCRNLLIYLVPTARTSLLKGLLRLLVPGGLLFVGHAEVAALRAIGMAMESPPEAFACRHVPHAPTAAPSPVWPTRRAAPVRPPAARPEAMRSEAMRPEPRRVEPARPRTQAENPMAQAARLADAGRLDAARALLLDEVATGTLTADLFHLLALVESAGGDDEACEGALRRALYLDSSHYPSLMQLALLHDARGERTHARRLREKAARVKGGQHGS